MSGTLLVGIGASAWAGLRMSMEQVLVTVWAGLTMTMEQVMVTAAMVPWEMVSFL